MNQFPLDRWIGPAQKRHDLKSQIGREQRAELLRAKGWERFSWGEKRESEEPRGGGIQRENLSWLRKLVVQ